MPGLVLALLGALIELTVLGQFNVLGRSWDLHAMIGGSLLTIVGTQVVALGLCARAYAAYYMGERDAWLRRMHERFRLEHGLLLGTAFVAIGLTIGGVIVARWIGRGLGALSEANLAVLGATFIVVGVQIFFSSFLLSILGLRRPA